MAEGCREEVVVSFVLAYVLGERMAREPRAHLRAVLRDDQPPRRLPLSLDRALERTAPELKTVGGVTTGALAELLGFGAASCGQCHHIHEILHSTSSSRYLDREYSRTGLSQHGVAHCRRRNDGSAGYGYGGWPRVGTATKPMVN